MERKPYVIKTNYTFHVRYTVSASLAVFQVIKGEWQRQNRYAMRTFSGRTLSRVVKRSCLILCPPQGLLYLSLVLLRIGDNGTMTNPTPEAIILRHQC